MKTEHADQRADWRPAGRLSFAGERRKAVVVTFILGGLFIAAASRWVLQEVAARKEPYRFRQSVRMQAPPIPPDIRPGGKLSGSRAGYRPDYVTSMASGAPAGKTGQGIGGFHISEDYGELLESPAAPVVIAEPGEGLIAQRMEVRLGGSWYPRDGSGSFVEYRRHPGRPVRRPARTLYAVIFRLTTDHRGTLVDFELAGVVNKSNKVVQIDIPERYIEQARIRAAALQYQPAAAKNELLEQYDYFFFRPDNPGRVIPRPRRNETQ